MHGSSHRSGGAEVSTVYRYGYRCPLTPRNSDECSFLVFLPTVTVVYVCVHIGPPLPLTMSGQDDPPTFVGDAARDWVPTNGRDPVACCSPLLDEGVRSLYGTTVPMCGGGTLGVCGCGLGTAPICLYSLQFGAIGSPEDPPPLSSDDCIHRRTVASLLRRLHARVHENSNAVPITLPESVRGSFRWVLFILPRE